MKKFTSVFFLGVIACSAIAQSVKSPAELRNLSAADAAITALDLKEEVSKNGVAKKPKATRIAPRNNVARVITPPSADDKVIDQTPEGEMTLYSKQGFSYGYNWLTGMVSQAMHSGLSNVVKSPDGKKWYIQNPIYFFFDSEENWIVGDVEGDILTIQLPQLISYINYGTDEEPEEYWDYLLKLEFIPSAEDETTGWYYPTEDQTYKLRIKEDGSLESLEGEMMLGQCMWFEADEEEGKEAYYSWQGNGDVLFSASPVTEADPVVPENVEMEEWSLINGLTYRSLKVGVDGDDMYITGLFNGMPKAPIKGKIEGDKVTFASPQYLGAYYYNSSLAYFLAGAPVTEEENGETISYYEITDKLVFDYDAANKRLSSEGACWVSSSPTVVQYYVKVEKPYIYVPGTDFTVTQLQNPVITSFYDVDEEYGYDASIKFNFPNVDADRNILEDSKLYYEVIVDNEPFTFYNDIYQFPDGISEITQIPFEFEDEDIWVEDPDDEDGGYKIYSGIFYSGISHYVELRGLRDFENLGVRTLYKSGEDVVYSDIVWAPGYAPTQGVENVSDHSRVVETRYFDLLGRRLANPSAGIFVKQSVLEDGSMVSSKVVVR